MENQESKSKPERAEQPSGEGVVVQLLVGRLRDFAAQYAASNPPAYLQISGQEAAKLIDWLDTAIEELEDMVAQNCTMSDRTLDSCALSSHADAMHFLADMGKLVITAEAGRRVIGKWPDVSLPNA
jgi:hypothetical protein